jgi:putative flippase GtrA
MKQRDIELLRFLKYCTVGVMNTLITLGVILLCKSALGWNPYVANVLGYMAGLLNSFLWNRAWVFHSNGKYGAEAAKFIVGFGLCYGVQFLTVWGLSTGALADFEMEIPFFTLSGYGIATLVGNVVYTVANFIYNRLVTFTPSKC